MKDNLNAKIKIGKTRNLIFSSVNSSKFKNFKSYLNKTGFVAIVTGETTTKTIMLFLN